MKRFGLLLFGALLIVCTGCKTLNATKEITADVATLNSQCPVDCGNNVVMESVAYVDNALIFSYSVHQIPYNVETMEHNLKILTLTALVVGQKVMPMKLVRNIIDTGGKMVYYYRATSAYSDKKSFTIEISNKELDDFFKLYD